MTTQVVLTEPAVPDFADMLTATWLCAVTPSFTHPRKQWDRREANSRTGTRPSWAKLLRQSALSAHPLVYKQESASKILVCVLHKHTQWAKLIPSQIKYHIVLIRTYFFICSRVSTSICLLTELLQVWVYCRCLEIGICYLKKQQILVKWNLIQGIFRDSALKSLDLLVKHTQLLVLREAENNNSWKQHFTSFTAPHKTAGPCRGTYSAQLQQ